VPNFSLTAHRGTKLTSNGDKFLHQKKWSFVQEGRNMSPDDALIAVTSLGFASVFLALVIGLSDGDAKALMASVSSMTPAARKQARIDHLHYLTSVADEAMEARRSGKKLGRWEGA
jgi:hypothetical protein